MSSQWATGKLLFTLLRSREGICDPGDSINT